MLTLARFTTLAESYGGDLRRWPEELRAGAEALLPTSPEARRLLAEARTLDAAIAAAQGQEDDELWQPGEEAAALARLRAGVGARIAATEARPAARRSVPRGWFARLPVNLGWVGMATGGSFAVVAGLLIGATYATTPALSPAQGNVLAMLQPAPIAILAD
jgi:hypothetical protein